MLDTICTLPIASDVFVQSIHPTEPLLAVGLSSGHVQTFRLPPIASDGANGSNGQNATTENGYGQIVTQWRTRRHKGSCRALGWGIDGRELFSAGTDGVLKCADAETGKVVAKVWFPLDRKTGVLDAPCLLHALSPQTLLLATDSSALHLYDLRAPTAASFSTPSKSADAPYIPTRPHQTYHPHTDYISSLTPLPPSSESTLGFPKQWLSTGGTTLALTDLRRGVLVRSEDQGEELLSSVFVSGLARGKGAAGSKGEKAVIGGSEGVLTLWERGVWDDQDERIFVSRDKESLDVLCEVPGDLGIEENLGSGRKVAGGKMLVVGVGDGSIRAVRLGVNKVVGMCRHDEVEGLVGLGFDVEGRMISAGGSVIKVWGERLEENEAEIEDGVDEVAKREADSDESGEEDGEEDESSEEEKVSRKRKKRKRDRGKSIGGGEHAIVFTNMD